MRDDLIEVAIVAFGALAAVLIGVAVTYTSYHLLSLLLGVQ